MKHQRVIAYETPEVIQASDREGLAAFVLGIAAVCMLLALVLLARHNLATNWLPLLLVTVCAVAMLGLIAGPAGCGSRRSGITLAALLINAACLASVLGLVLYFESIASPW